MKKSKKYVIRNVNTEHKGHEVSKEQYQYYPAMMKIDNEEELYNMLKTGSGLVLVKKFYEEKTGKKINSKQIYNIPTKYSNNGQFNKVVNEMIEIKKVIEAREKFDGKRNFHLVTADDDETIYVIFYQNDKMKEVYAKYGDVLFIDGTYR